MGQKIPHGNVQTYRPRLSGSTQFYSEGVTVKLNSVS